MNDNHDPKKILSDLDAGRIDVGEALRQLEDPAAAGPSTAEGLQPARGWRDGWLVPFALSLALTAFGGWAASHQGWWWLAAGPALFVGIFGMVASVLSRTSPWVHIRVRSRRPGGDRLTISLPLPVRLVAWALRLAGPWTPGLDRTTVDELLMALDGNVSAESPLYVLVDDDEDGERVEVTLG
ncbi:MAG: hypothetical protein A2Y93_15380 [Chloroflexi bacterium RBG_13_68_17]|jgi:hypothetical protein|nr:MAG: hypothetical protein A2Y93_15380 [Chloroflexi bacterium RBG_13_68_17]